MVMGVWNMSVECFGIFLHHSVSDPVFASRIQDWSSYILEMVEVIKGCVNKG